MGKIGVGVLGATGMVGQYFVLRLQNHPWFEITALTASERSIGKTYAQACNWKVSAEMPAMVRDMPVVENTPDLPCFLVFSALPGGMAGPVEEAMARAGYLVFSNARDHRMDADIPLLVPEVNPEHAAMIEYQRRQRSWKGFIVTNPNCCAIPLVVALKPLQQRFGLKRVLVVTMQALSGAGYPGLPSLDILDNVIPFIGGEEEKVESEPLKLLGRLDNNQFKLADFSISAHCHRVATISGHLESVSVELASKASLEEIKEALYQFRALPQELGLPSAPQPVIILRPEIDRPQPRYDRDAGEGMAVSVGRIRPCPVLGYKFNVLGNNVIRGAAGASILNAELLKAKGYFA